MLSNKATRLKIRLGFFSAILLMGFGFYGCGSDSSFNSTTPSAAAAAAAAAPIPISVSAAPLIPVPVVPPSTAITGIAAASAGQVTISSPNTLVSGDIVAISGSTKYDGTFTVVTATPPSFTVAAPFVGPLVSSGTTPPVVQPQILATPVTGIAPSATPGQVTLVANNTLTDGAPIVISGSSIPALDGPTTVIAPTPSSFSITTTFVPPPVPPAGTPLPPGPTLGVILSGGGVLPNCTTTTTGTATAVTLPSLAIVPSRFTGVAPLAVSFDATSTTATATTRPFHDIEYRWAFGESAGPGAGTWSNGSRPGVSSRNTATGPVAAHVFETPGTYIVNLTATDGTNTVSNSCIQIAVTDPNVVFAGASTVCIANSTATAGSGGCPTGASTPTGTASFDTALAACLTGAAPHRCLFNRGDTFTSAATGAISTAGPLTVGAYGSGNPPIVNSNSTNRVPLQLTNSAVNDLRIMDLEVVGSGSTDTRTCLSVVAEVTNVTILRLSCHDIGRGIIMASGSSIAGSIIQDSHIYNLGSNGGVGIFGWAINSAFLGNFIGPFNPGSEHNIRLQPGQRVAISNNTLTTPGEDGGHGKNLLTIRAVEHTNPNPIDETYPAGTALADTQYVYISDNKLSSGGTSAQMFQVAPAGNTQNNWISDVIAERNWLVYGSAGAQGIYGHAVRLTVRNNLCDTTGGVFRVCYSLAPGDRTGNVPPPNDNRFYNNTCFAGDATGQFFCLSLESGPGPSNAITNSVVVNNLSYGPLSTQAKLLFTSGASVTGTVGASGTFGNSSDAQVTASNPNFLNASGLFNTPSDFKLPPSGSYAIGGGLSDGTVRVWSDFFLATEPLPRDMGAVNH